ncbi:MAG: efflux RND transporter periplasmic adaptor subunit [Pseudomonadaceae bacterium]|jgi:membrane fusion protein (multidrug efflux system)|nr:efflux RND transporter periplasmic adaptor subunit [Pseudomonadaceae bacterium]
MPFSRHCHAAVCGFSLSLLLSSLAQAAAPAQTAPTPAPPSVSVEVVAVASQPLVLEYPALTAGYKQVQVRAQVNGILRERSYVEGSKVKKGQVLFVIDPKPYEAALARAKGSQAQMQARTWQTERELKRIRELQKRGFASEKELDDATSNYEQSKANLESAKADVQSRQIDLDYTTVEAPISGASSQETVSEGSLMVAGDPNASLLTSITQLDPLYVNFSYPDADAERFRREIQAGTVRLPDGKKLTAELKMGDGSLYPLKGNVDFIDSLINTGTGSVSARVVIPNPDLKLFPGQFVRVLIEGLSIPDAISVPQRAISQTPAGTAVFVVDGQNIAHLRPVTLGSTVADRWIVKSGLQAGEKVIVEGISKVRPDMPVSTGAAPAAVPAAKP